MKKSVFLLLLALSLTGCAANGAKVDMQKKTYEGNGYSMTMEIPVIHGPADFAREINAQYTELCDSILNKFPEEAERSAVPKDTLKLTQKVAFNKNGILSIVGECESFTGGPHSNLSRVVKNIDMKNKRIIKLENLFADSGYTDRINSYIETTAEHSPADFRDLWKKPTMTSEREFYLSPDGLVIFFTPYELSYYSKGFVEIKIPYEEIRNYMNPEYSVLLQ